MQRYEYFLRYQNILIDYNLIKEFPGEGTALFDLDGVKVRVTNILGSAFINEEVNNPYFATLDLLESHEEANIHIVDFHGEATGEKKSYAYAFDGRLTAVLGTHTRANKRCPNIRKRNRLYIRCWYVWI